MARPILAFCRNAACAALWVIVLPAWAESAQALLDRANADTRVDPEAARRHAEQALRQLATQPDADQQIRAHVLLCGYHSERDRSQAQRHIDAGRALLPLAHRPGLRAPLANCEGELHEYANDNGRAAALYQEAVTVAEQHGERELLADSLFLRGYLAGVQGDFAAGLADLQRAQDLYEQLDLPQQVRNTVNGIASVYSRVGDYQQARDYYEASLKLQEQAGLTRDLVVTRYNLGRVQEKLEDWTGAEQAFNEVLRLSRQISYVRGEAYALRGLAVVQNSRGNHIDALALLDRAALQQGATTDQMLRAQILLQRGIALRGLQRPHEGIEALRSSLELFVKADSVHEVGSARAELARALAAIGDWRARVRTARAVSDGPGRVAAAAARPALCEPDRSQGQTKCAAAAAAGCDRARSQPGKACIETAGGDDRAGHRSRRSAGDAGLAWPDDEPGDADAGDDRRAHRPAESPPGAGAARAAAAGRQGLFGADRRHRSLQIDQ